VALDGVCRHADAQSPADGSRPVLGGIWPGAIALPPPGHRDGEARGSGLSGTTTTGSP
jgi:hypothetical protein